MNIGKSFTYPFEDSSWLSKLLIGGLIGVVPVLNFALVGYMIEVTRRTMSNHPEPLPGWDDFGKKWLDGLYNFFAGMIYSLPVIVTTSLALILGVVPLIFSSNANQDSMSLWAAGGGMLVFCLSCLTGLYALLLSLIMPALQVHYAHKGSFSAFFNLREVFNRVSQNLGEFLTAWVIAIAASLLIGLATGLLSWMFSIIPCIGWIGAVLVSLAVAPYTTAFYGRIMGEYGSIAYND
jgi:hypothetical protein